MIDRTAPHSTRLTFSRRTAAAGRALAADLNALRKKRRARSLFLFLAAALLSLYIAIPVLFIPGNDLLFFISITPWWGFILFFLLAILISFSITSRLFFGGCKQCTTGNKKVIGNSALVAGSVLPAVLTCPILAVSVLSFLLPITSIWALVGYRWLVIVLALIGMVLLLIRRYWRMTCSEYPSL